MKNNGVVWAVGKNNGLAGDQHSSGITTPLAVFSGVKAVSAGRDYSLFLKTDDTVWATGENSSGQLGNGTKIFRAEPFQVLSEVKAISTSAVYYFRTNAHSLFLKKDNTVWATGSNSSGQFGNGTTVSQTTPIQVMSGVTAIAAGYNHSLFLKTDGSVWAAGANYYGQLGDGTKSARTSAVKVMTGVKAIAAGVAHSVFLTDDGRVLASGAYTNDQLGNPSVIAWTLPVVIGSGAKAISAGAVHAMYLKTDGTAWGWGLNSGAQLGGDEATDYRSPRPVLTEVDSISAGVRQSMFVKSDGTVWAVGAGRTAPMKVINLDANLSDSADLVSLIPSAGDLAPAFSNNIFSYSVGVDNATSTFSITPTPLVANSLVTITVNGASSQPGTNIPLEVGKNLIDVTITAPDGIGKRIFTISVSREEAPPIPQAAIDAWGFHSLFLKADGTAWGAGSNNHGQLGDGTNTDRPRPVPILNNVMAISAGGQQHGGENFSLFLRTDYSAWASGRNTTGQLGDGTQTNRSTPVNVLSEVQAISAGSDYSLFLRKDGSVWNSGSSVLTPGTTIWPTPQPLILNGIPLGGMRAISAGWFHSLYLKSDGNAYATGRNASGQLGDGTTTDTDSAFVLSLSDVQAISAGARHSLFLKNDGTVWATGANENGQLGDGTNSRKTRAVVVMSGAQAISAGAAHSLILKKDGTAWATGQNLHGQLGDGTMEDRTTPVKVLNGVKAIAAGSSHSLFLKTDGSIWATGFNAFGQHGNGTKASSDRPVQVMGQISGPPIAPPGPQPEIAIEAPKGTTVVSGGDLNFGTLVLKRKKDGTYAPKKKSLTFVVRNSGAADLTGLSASVVGADAAHFKVTAKFTAPLKAGKTRTFKIEYAPKEIGSRSVQLLVLSNDPDESPYVINLAGNANEFGSTARSLAGAGSVTAEDVIAPELDSDGDRIADFLEWAVGSDPVAPSPSPLRLELAGGKLVARYPRNKALAAEGISLHVEWSPDLLIWRSDQVKETIESESKGLEFIRAEVLIDGAPRMFLRLRALEIP